MEDIIKIKKEGYKFFIHKKQYGTQIKYKQSFQIIIDDTSPLTFIRKDDNGVSGISLTLKKGQSTTKVIQYSLDTVNWQDYTYGTEIKLNKDEFVQFRSPDETDLPFSYATSSAPAGSAESVAVDSDFVSKFNTSGNGIYECYGRTSSLYNDNTETSGTLIALFSGTRITRAPFIDLINYTNNYKFAATFKNCTLLKEIPFTFDVDYSGTLGNMFFCNMFYGCTSLETHPAIVKTCSNSEQKCMAMFYGCSNLKEIPPFIFNNVNKEKTFAYMYCNCTSLVDLTNFWPTDFMSTNSSSATKTFEGMFYGCTNLKYFSSQINFTYLYGNTDFMYTFRYCTSLIQAPNFTCKRSFDATFLGTFEGCTSLVQAPNFIFYEIGSNVRTFYNTFYGCTNLQYGGSILRQDFSTYPRSNIATINPSAEMFAYMYKNCTNLIYPPTINFYFGKYNRSLFNNMFYGCTKLVQPFKFIVLDTSISANYIHTSMYYNCAQLENAPGLPFIGTAGSQCFTSTFEGCTNLTNAPQLLLVDVPSQCYKRIFTNCKKLNKVFRANSSWTVTNENFNAYVSGVASKGSVVSTATEEPSIYGTSTIPLGWTRKHGEVERYYWDLQKGEELNLGIYLRDIYDITLGVDNALSGRNEFMRFYEESLDWTFSVQSDVSTTNTKMAFYPSFTKSSSTTPVTELINNQVYTFKPSGYFYTYNSALYTNIQVIDKNAAAKGNVGCGTIYSFEAPMDQLTQFLNNAQIILSCPDTTYKSTCQFFQIRTIHGVFIPHKDGRHLINYTTNELIDTGHQFTAVKYTDTVTNDKICGIDFYKWMYEDDE